MINIPSDENKTCIKCGLWKTCRKPFMDADGPDDARLLVIGEAPGKDEDKEGIPFVGEAGNLLRPSIDEVWGSSVAYTNVVRCRPPDNKITKKAIDYCVQFALEDMRKYDPEIILLMGNSPLSGILGESGITAWNGVVVEKDGRKIVPIFHPAYVLRNRSMLDEWLETICNALASGKLSKGKFERIIPRTLAEVEEMAATLADSEYIAFDTEIRKLDAFHAENKLLSVSFAIDGYTWSLPINHKESWWDITVPKGLKTKISEREKVIGIVLDVLTSHDGNVIAHNAKFDQMQVYALTGAWFDIGGDTMLQSHLIDSRPGLHGLKRLAGIHLGMYDYERPLLDYCRGHREADPKRGGSYDNVPLDILLPYGGLDSEAVWLLHPMFYEKLSDKQRILYDQLLLGVSDALSIMQSNGMTLDMWIADRYRTCYEIRRKRLFEDIQHDPKVKRYTKDVRASDKRHKLFTFNPGSFKQKGELYFDYYKIPTRDVPLTDRAKLLMDAGLKESERHTTSSKALSFLEPKYPILHTIRYFNMLGKAIGTYLAPAASGAWLSGDGKARTNFNMHTTISGRLSASDPFNSQNIPVPEKEPGTILASLPIKNIFTHDYVNFGPGVSYEKRYGGGVVMAADFSGIELRVFASVSNCEEMLAIHRSGKDFHSMVAVLAMQHIPVYDIKDRHLKKITVPIRYRYKWTNWTLLYGGDAYTLSNLYNIPMDEAEETVATYFETFPRVQEFQQECVEFAEDHGYIESVFGRRAQLPYINEMGDRSKQNHSRREAMNIPIQSAASETLLCALYILQQRLNVSNYLAHTVNTVHDSIVLSVPKHEIYPVAELLKDTMENVIEHAKTYMPSIDFSWLTCPLKTTIEVGSHYGALVDLEDWDG